jgi:hypothetical protein
MGACIFDQGLNFSLVQPLGKRPFPRRQLPGTVGFQGSWLHAQESHIALNKYNRKFIFTVYKQLAKPVYNKTT